MSKISKSSHKKAFFKRSVAQNAPKLDVNLKGFLCVCDPSHKKNCVKEASNLLDPHTNPTSNIPEKAVENDIEDELKRNISEINSQTNIRALDTGIKHSLFLKVNIEDPVSVAYKIACEINETKRQQTKHLIKLIPIEITCKAHLKDIKNAFQPLLEKYFLQDAKTFSVVFKHRYNNSLNKKEVIDAIAGMIENTNKGHKVNLECAQLFIIVEVIKGFALIGVVPEFLQLKKYNLLALADLNDAEDKN